MQIHELNNFTGTLGSGAYLAVDDGTDTGKLSTQQLLAATEARIDNIIAGPAPSAEEIVDARLGDDGVTYPSLGDAIRDQVGDLKSDLKNGMYGKENFGLQYNFVRGTLLNGELITENKLYRVSSNGLMQYDRDLYVSVANGFRFSIHTFVNGVFSSDSGLSAIPKLITKGTTFKICIARVTEDASEVADINNFVNQVTFSSETSEKLTQLSSEESTSYSKELEFVQGGYSITIGSVIGYYDNNTRIRTPIYNCEFGSIISVSVISGYKYHLTYLDENNVILDIDDFSTTSKSLIAKGCKFGVMLAKTSNGNLLPSDGANVSIQIANSQFPMANPNIFGNMWGKNLISEISAGNGHWGNVWFQVNEDNSVTLNGTSNTSIDYYIVGSQKEAAVLDNAAPNCPYVLSFGVTNKSGVVCRLISTNGSDLNGVAIGSDIPFIMGDSLKIIFRISSGVTFNNYTIYPMIRNTAFGNVYQKGVNIRKIDDAVNSLSTINISDLYNTIPYKNASMYNGMKFQKEMVDNYMATIGNDEDYSYHDGTLVKKGDVLYAVYCRYSGNGGDAAVNPNATVRMVAFDLSGNRLFNKIIAEKNGTYAGVSQTGGAGSPNAYIVGDDIYILYTANMNNTYCEMCAVYSITNDTVTYHQVLVDGDSLNNAWINEYFGETYTSSEYTSAQSNCTIATDGTNYYIGWVCGTKLRGKALIFKTTDFINWEVVYEYTHDIVPVYEMPLIYNDGYLYYAIRPMYDLNGVVGKISVGDFGEKEYAYYPNCSSRPLFFMWDNEIYLLTNPVNRASFQIYRVDQSDFKYTDCVADTWYPSNYPSFVTDEDNNLIYTLRSNYYMDISKFNFALTATWSVQGIIMSILGID